MSQRLNETQWSVQQITRLRALCRFCSELNSPPLPCFVDLMNFQRHLLAHYSMNVSTVREYVTRLRRIDTLLTGGLQTPITPQTPELQLNLKNLICGHIGFTIKKDNI